MRELRHEIGMCLFSCSKSSFNMLCLHVPRPLLMCIECPLCNVALYGVRTFSRLQKYFRCTIDGRRMQVLHSFLIFSCRLSFSPFPFLSSFPRGYKLFHSFFGESKPIGADQYLSSPSGTCSTYYDMAYQRKLNL